MNAPRILGNRYALLKGTDVEGGLSTVYRASDLGNDGKTVAVKILGRPRVASDLLPIAFRREVGALRALDHPNIVSLIDSGQDPASGEYYLVLEWLPRRLDDVAERIRSDGGWDDFAAELGLPLLRALAYAHERGVVHRDVKPSNVLLTESGTPKLVDFGISKLKTVIDDDARTLANFGSPAYVPPDSGSSSTASRDLYAFAVLVLATLTEVPIRVPSDVQVALAELDAPPAVVSLVKRCLAEDPARRPASAAVILQELEQIQGGRTRGWTTRPKLHLRLTTRARTLLDQYGVAAPDEPALGAWLRDEFGEGFHASLTPEGRLRLVGNHYDLIAVDDDPPNLLITGVGRPEGASLDRAREGAAYLEFDLVAHPPINHATAREMLTALRWAIEEHERSLRDERADAERFRLFDQWERQLHAKEAYEAAREPAIEYEHVVVEGQRALFTLPDPVYPELLGQQRMVDREGAKGPKITGEVDFARGTELVLHLARPMKGEPPRSGRLILDLAASRIARERQLRALSWLRLGTPDLARPDIGSLVLDPSRSRPAEAVEVDSWQNPDLDDAKRVAVAHALGAHDFFLVKGPPGTGKTAFIAELVAQVVRRDANARVLIASQTHVALDNALLRVRRTNQELRIVRLGRQRDAILPDVYPMLLDAQRDGWVAEVRSRSEKFVEDLASRAGADLQIVRAALEIGQLISTRTEAAAVDSQLGGIDEQLHRADDPDAAIDSAMTQDERETLAAQRADLREERRTIGRRAETLANGIASKLAVRSAEIDAFGVDELRDFAAECFPASDEHGNLRDLVVLQGQWLDQVGHGRAFDEALLASANVVGATCIGFATGLTSRLHFDLCIVDEATKATATEALVPIVKAERWVLVGDQKQLPPFQDEALRDTDTIATYDLDRDELGRTLFDRLTDGLDPSLIAFLEVQHRMCPAIGNLISACFYDGRLSSADDCPEPLPRFVLRTPVVWVDTHERDDRHERRAGSSGLSFANDCEAAVLARVLRGINERLGDGLVDGTLPDDERISVLVLSGYLPQVAGLTRRIGAMKEMLPNLDVEVASVDASQGREADLVVFSVVRSNAEGRLGFLEQSTRINVALSRGRSGLVIIGDAPFAASGDGPLARVLSHMGRRGSDCNVEPASAWS